MGIMLFAFILMMQVWDLAIAAKNKRDVKKQALNIASFCMAFCVILYVAWPYLWKSPVHNFLESFTKLSRFELWNGSVLLGGKFFESTQLPWTYFPAWFAITVPELWLAAGSGGIVWIAIDFIKTPLLFTGNTTHRNLLLYVACFFAPVIAVIVLHSVIYDDWRHLYFVYPPFILAGLYFINKLFQSRYKRFMQGALFLQIALTTAFMAGNHPHNQVYFNHLVSHAPQHLRKNYEMDYWGCSFKQGLDYLLEHDRSIPIVINCDYQALLENNVMMLAPEDRKRIRFANMENAGYYLTNFRGHYTDYPPSDSVYAISVANSEILGVYKTEKDTAMQRKMREQEITNLRTSLINTPDDLDAMARIAAAFQRNNQFDSAERVYKRAIELNPANTNLLTGLAGSYYVLKQFPKAIEVFRKVIALDKTDAEAKANIAVCFYYTGQYDSTIQYLKQAIALNPGNAGSYISLANTYQATGQADSAKKYLGLYREATK